MKTRTFPKRPLAALFKYAFSLCINMRWRCRQLTPSGTFVLLMLVATSLYLHAKPSAESPSDNDSVRVSNFTALNDKELSKILANTLKPELKEFIVRNKLAVFAQSASFDEVKTCFGSIGLTEAAPAGRHPRYPATTDFSITTITSEGFAAASSFCESIQLISAAIKLNARPLEELLKEIESTKALKKVTEKEPAEPGRVRVFATGIANTDALLDVIHKHDFGNAFDYREVELVVTSSAFQYNNGNFVCVAFVGISSPAPQGRTARWPGYIKGFVRQQAGGDASGCKQFVAEHAIDDLLKSPWTPQGLLKNFSATKEDGVALPDPVKVAKAKALIDRASKPVTVSATTRSTNHVSCTNNCSNGNCVRRFPDGRTERWQAPRKFNPFNGNWEWDTTTNACGL